MNELVTTTEAAPPPELSEVLDPALAEQVIANGVNVAKQATDVIEKLKLYVRIRGKKFITVEGYAVLAAMWQLGVREVSCEKDTDGNYVATCELIRLSDGAVVGRGSAMCGADERDWSKRPEFQRRSMAITRAVGKAYRMSLAWIVKLAGYEPTPSVEVDADAGQVKASPQPINLTRVNTRGGGGGGVANHEIVIDATSDGDQVTPTQLKKIRTLAARAGIKTPEAQRDLLDKFKLWRLRDATGVQGDKIISHLEWMQTQQEAPF